MGWWASGSGQSCRCGLLCCNDYPGRRRRASVEMPGSCGRRADRSAGHRGGGTAAVGPVIVHLVLLILFSALAGLDRPISFRPNATVIPHCRGLGIVRTFTTSTRHDAG